MDNVAAIVMINECKPTTHSRHIDIQFFCYTRVVSTWQHCHAPHSRDYQPQWSSYQGTCGWTLHSRHAHWSMGHYQPE
jgi:hypothetical protein